ncbi:MAG: rubrerythrin [Oscillospiraceae bacterium]|nr:rubrerythrin [Oscillospiraceae bacterium]
MIISQKERKVLLRAQQGELDAVKMYNALARTVKDPRDAETFRRLAAEEGHHAAVFKALTGQLLKAKNTKAILLPILYRVLGRKRLYPIIAKGEYDAADTYRPVAESFPEVESVKKDEQRHGDTVLALLQ